MREEERLRLFWTGVGGERTFLYLFIGTSTYILCVRVIRRVRP